MRPSLHFPVSARPLLLPALTVVLAALIFVADTLTDLEIAVAVFYVAVVLLSLNFCTSRGVVLVSAACAVLTVLSFFLTRGGAPHSGLINCIISISAIGATTYLAQKIVSATAAMQEARTQLVSVARVTTLGELAASIAHEVNQPLAAIITSCSACVRWLSTQPPNLERANQAIERMRRDASRASEVIGRIRSLANRAPPEAKSFDINNLIQETLALTRREIERAGISVQTELADGVPAIFADPVQLQQVILNLIINAIDAMSLGHQGLRQLSISSLDGGAGVVVVQVRDSGSGLQPSQTDRVFDAFYTTKRDGMGLGLTISRTIVEAHGGRLWAEPASPQGAILRFSIPAEKRKAS